LQSTEYLQIDSIQFIKSIHKKNILLKGDF